MSAFAGFTKTPGGAQWWNEVEPFYPPDFVARIEQAAVGAPALTDAMSWFSVDSSKTQEA